YEWAYIFGAVCPQRRATAALVLPAADTDAMSMHLAEIGRRVAPGAHAALVIDGAGYHVAARLAVPRNITLVRLPPYAPELNPVENVWEYLRGNKLAVTVFESYDDIVDKSCAAWRFFADDPNASHQSHPELGPRSILEADGIRGKRGWPGKEGQEACASTPTLSFP